jgi:hypothetical protein
MWLLEERRFVIMEQINLEAEIVERKDTPNAWGVEAIDYNNDGAIYMAVFSGPDAKERALEYARSKFAMAKAIAA